ncbi:regulatory protein RecX [Persicitalea jodogahamensis]|uniref:Regulatory protein RecX n=1 Tax=Persicitalea jodogahamensis TaxID=402147 RepID=A0A8J3DE54_9BACT|nr:regulatory protein RecX [Persicitalea jodogahamensis]GHB88338.1 recombinase RecX [Persicitalea jodogahamensis]
MDRLLLQKAASYCAYQERTQDEVRQRLKKWGVWEEDEADELIAELISMNYLSEERFAKTYAGSKFRQKKWGKRRIKQELSRRGLTDYNIDQGMDEISETDYENTLKDLLAKKQQQLERTESDARKRKQKLVRYALSKGYESELVWRILKEG